MEATRNELQVPFYLGTRPTSLKAYSLLYAQGSLLDVRAIEETIWSAWDLTQISHV